MVRRQQPGSLVKLSTTAAAHWLISHLLATPHPDQEVALRKQVLRLLAPPLLQEVLECVLYQLATHYAYSASPAVIAAILRILTHPGLKDLQLSELSYIGAVELQTLDNVELVLINLLPSIGSLTHLNLSTHRNKITLPSCSSTVLQVLGSCCSNLVLLNLNNNNRVTSEGLFHLYPNSDQPGCIALENIYVQDCSIDPEDVAMLIHFFPNLKLVGYRELGASIQILLSKPKMFGRKKKKCHYTLKLTHVDNTKSQMTRSDGNIVDLLYEYCPDLENLRIRVCDDDVAGLGKLSSLKHLELRFYSGVHHPIGRSAAQYFRTYGSLLSSLTIYCHCLISSQVQTIAESCCNLAKLYLHANVLSANMPLASSCNNLKNLEVLSLRVGHDELIITPAACDLLMFLLCEAQPLQELYLLLRCNDFTHSFVSTLLTTNPLSHLKVLVIDAPRRTLAAPMLELTAETVSLLVHSCPCLHTIGNLICWNVTEEEVAELHTMKRKCNYNLTVVCNQSNKFNDKLD